jgi:hypothetical protein
MTADLRLSKTPFPLTPALSLWERETCSPALEVIGSLDFTRRRQRCVPLPKGEG